MIDGSLLVTGGAGYLGRRLTRAWFDAGGDQVIVWVRAREAADLARLQSELASGVADGASRLIVVSGDLASDRAFENVDPGAIRAIVHAAAATRFNIDEATATVNVEGTRRLLTFAQRCARLADVTVLSSTRPGFGPERSPRSHSTKAGASRITTSARSGRPSTCSSASSRSCHGASHGWPR